MFAVIFEVHPKSEQWDTYLGYAKMLRPELEQIDGFVDNIRYRSLTREGWILSLSTWRDEKAVVRWRTKASHHEVQQKGRGEVFGDYHLRVGQLTRDTQLPIGMALEEQRLDETETGEAKAVTLNTANRTPDLAERAAPEDVAAWLGLERHDGDGLVAWDCFDAVLSPGNLILLAGWRDRAAAEAHERAAAEAHERAAAEAHERASAEAHERNAKTPRNARLRRVRIVRDYGMFDRHEAPQYHPHVVRSSPES